MATFFKRLNNDSGVSIIALIVALLLLSTFAMFIVWLLASHSDITSTFWKSQQTLYIADSGLRVNARKIQTNWSNWNVPGTFPDLNFAGGTITTVVVDDDDGDGNLNVDRNGKLIMTSTGTLDDVQRTVQAEITYSVPALDCAVYTTGDLTIGGSAVVTGQTAEFAPSLPVLDIPAAIAMAKANKLNGYASRTDGNYFRGTFPSGSNSPTSLNGVIYIDTYENGNPASVTLNNLATTDGQPAFLVVMGYIHITANFVFKGLIYNAGTTELDTDITGNNRITGGILSSHDTFIRGSSRVTYDSAMMKNALTNALLTENPSNYIYEWSEVQ